MRRNIGLAGVLIVVLLLACCSASSGSIVKVPTEATPPAGATVLCPLALFTPFTLAGDPTKSPAVWGINSFGEVFQITWPAGFAARFTPTLQILDPTGAVVATGGVVITDAGGGGNGALDGEYLCSIDGKTY